MAPLDGQTAVITRHDGKLAVAAASEVLLPPYTWPWPLQQQQWPVAGAAALDAAVIDSIICPCTACW